MDVQITVASKVPGAEGKKTSKVIDSTGKTWHVYNDKFHQFLEGNSYLITKYKINDFKGTSYYMVEAFAPVSGGSTARGSEMLRGQTNGGAAVPPRFQSSDNTKIDEQRRMDIFICGHWNNLIRNPNVHPLELTYEQKVLDLQETRRAWLAVMGPNRPSSISTSAARMDPPSAHKPVLSPDMNDEIPF